LAVGILIALAVLTVTIWIANAGRRGQGESPVDPEGAASPKPESPAPPAAHRPKAVRSLGTDLPADGLALPQGGKVGAVVFSRDGKMLAAGVAEPNPGGAAVWDVATGKEVCRLWPDLPILCLGFSREGGLLMGSRDRSLLHFPLTGTKERCYEGTAVIQSLSFSRDGSIMAIGFSDGGPPGRVKRFYSGGDEIDTRLGENPGPVQQILFSPHDDTLAVAYRSGLVNLCPAPKTSASLVFVRQAEKASPPPALAFSPDRPALAVALGREVRWWNLTRGAWEDRVLREEKEITALAYTPDGKYLAVVGRSPDVTLWKVSTEQKVHTFRGHRESVSAVACHPDGSTLATGSTDGDVRVWDLRGVIPEAE
jgi:WD40 repeat protein